MSESTHTMLVAADLSPGAHKAVDEALVLAEALGSRVFLMHIAAPDPDFVGFEVGPQHVRDWRADELRDEHKQLEDWQSSFQSKGLQCTAMLVAGPTVEKLLEESERVEADMIVMGTHGHGRVYDILVGSTAQGVLKKSNIPVVLVPIREDGTTAVE